MGRCWGSDKIDTVRLASGHIISNTAAIYGEYKVPRIYYFLFINPDQAEYRRRK